MQTFTRINKTLLSTDLNSIRFRNEIDFNAETERLLKLNPDSSINLIERLLMLDEVNSTEAFISIYDVYLESQIMPTYSLYIMYLIEDDVFIPFIAFNGSGKALTLVDEIGEYREKLLPSNKNKFFDVTFMIENF